MERILVVEDDAGGRKLLVRILSSEGYQVEEVSSAPSALKIIHSSPSFREEYYPYP